MYMYVFICYYIQKRSLKQAKTSTIAFKFQWYALGLVNNIDFLKGKNSNSVTFYFTNVM